jgi:predicted Holliday junction resolvase-like endonuclease
MKNDLIQFFAIQRNIFGVCPRSTQLFRLSDCRVYLKTKPKKDWMDRLHLESQRLDRVEERLDEKEEHLREIARKKGRQLAQRAVRRIDPVFTPRRLNPDDAKVVFHPIDYVVFDGMKNSETMKGIILLDREPKSPDRCRLQRSIRRVIEGEKFEWITIRVGEDGSIKQEG